MKDTYGPWAVVTGAASGIGRAFALELAARGLDLVLVDVQADALQAVALELSPRVAVRTVVVDLADANCLATIRSETDDLDVGLFINNAGLSLLGPFIAQEPQALLRVLDVNCRASVLLLQHFAQRLAERRRGGIIVVSSSSCTQGTALFAHYAATKAYAMILAEGLWAELKPLGVDVLALLPGTTMTPALQRLDPQLARAPGVPVMTAHEVVVEGLAALGRQPTCIPGRGNRISAAILGRLLPRRKAIELVAQGVRRLYPSAG
jgi:short-subunit dehydrogenase